MAENGRECQEEDKGSQGLLGEAHYSVVVRDYERKSRSALLFIFSCLPYLIRIMKTYLYISPMMP